RAGPRRYCALAMQNPGRIVEQHAPWKERGEKRMHSETAGPDQPSGYAVTLPECFQLVVGSVWLPACFLDRRVFLLAQDGNAAAGRLALAHGLGPLVLILRRPGAHHVQQRIDLFFGHGNPSKKFSEPSPVAVPAHSSMPLTAR